MAFAVYEDVDLVEENAVIECGIPTIKVDVYDDVAVCIDLFPSLPLFSSPLFSSPLFSSLYSPFSYLQCKKTYAQQIESIRTEPSDSHPI
jgi:hypothetical protein